MNLPAPIGDEKTCESDRLEEVERRGKRLEMLLAFEIHRAGGVELASATNAASFTAYTLAVQANHRLFVQFLFNMIIYFMTPKWFNIANVLAASVSAFVFVWKLGLWPGFLYWLILYAFIFQNLSQ